MGRSLLYMLLLCNSFHLQHGLRTSSRMSSHFEYNQSTNQTPNLSAVRSTPSE